MLNKRLTDKLMVFSCGLDRFSGPKASRGRLGLKNSLANYINFLFAIVQSVEVKRESKSISIQSKKRTLPSKLTAFIFPRFPPWGSFRIKFLCITQMKLVVKRVVRGAEMVWTNLLAQFKRANWKIHRHLQGAQKTTFLGTPCTSQKQDASCAFFEVSANARNI